MNTQPVVVSREALIECLAFAQKQPNGASFTKAQIDGFRREIDTAHRLETELLDTRDELHAARDGMQTLRDKLSKARRPGVRSFIATLAKDHPAREITIRLGPS